MSLTITDVDAVRSEGALKAPSEAAGAATDKQIQAAIRAAKRKMLEKIDLTTYDTVRDFSAIALENENNDDEHEAFLHAESCYTLAHLCRKLNAQQLSDTGIIQSIEIGKARQGFASSEEVKKISAVWEQDGNRWLAPYLAVPLDPIQLTPTSFASKNGTFYVGGL